MKKKIVHASGDEPVESVIRTAMKRAVEQTGMNEETPPLPDLKAGLEQLQKELSALTVEAATAEEVKTYEEGLQELAIQVAPEAARAQAFLDAVKERGLEEEPVLVQRVKTAKEYLASINSSKVTHFVDQVRLFLGLEYVRVFGDLRKKLEELAEQDLTFKTRRDPRIPMTPETVISREGEEEFVYLPQKGSVISQHCWEHVIAARDRIKEAGARYRESISEQLKTFREKATSGLNPWKAVHEEVGGIIFLSTSFPETRRKTDETGEVIEAGKFVYEETGRTRFARMLIRVGRRNFTVAEVFEPDNIGFILNQARNREGEIRWFPLDPGFFDPGRARGPIANIVWPALETWYRSFAIQAKSDISVVELLADKPGFCGIFILGAETLNRGPDNLTLGVRGTGKGTLILEEYLSRNGVFEFDDLLNQEFTLEETKETGGEVSPEWRRLSLQARILQGFLNLAAGWQRNKEITELRNSLSPLISVTEGLKEGKTGHSVFHIPRAIVNTRGPAHLTPHVEWQKDNIVLHDYASWVDPREGRSKGPIELDEATGISIPRQPAKDEEPVIRVFRYLLNQRKDYEAWKASQGEAGEENNGAS